MVKLIVPKPKYNINEKVIYDNWVSCIITQVLDNIDGGVMYRVEFIDVDNSNSSLVVAEYELDKRND